MKIQLLLVIVVTVTSYRSVPNQTDDTPFITSIGHRTSQEGCAVSPNLMNSETLCYGNAVYIPNIGIRVVNDVTHPRLKNLIDVWVLEHEDESRVGVRKNQTVTVWESPQRRCKK